MPKSFINGKIVFLVLVVLLAGHTQDFKVIKIEDLEALVTGPSDKIQVINFWATWCAPCVKELPVFEKAHLKRKDIQVSLISMDAELDPTLDKVNRFIVKKKLKSSVYVLVEKNPNSWIDRVDKSWSGAIPATLFVNTKTGKRKFVEGGLREADLSKWIDSVM